MDVAHPDMLQALVDTVPPGFRSAPVLNAMKHLQAVNNHLRAVNDTQRAALASFNAPHCPAGQFLHVHKHPTLGALDCHLEWEEGDPEVGWAERVTLHAAYLRGVDIADRLHPREVEAIEREAARQPKQILEPA